MAAIYGDVASDGTVLRTHAPKIKVEGGMADPKSGWTEEEKAADDLRCMNRKQRKAVESLMRKGMKELKAIQQIMKKMPYRKF